MTVGRARGALSTIIVGGGVVLIWEAATSEHVVRGGAVAITVAACLVIAVGAWGLFGGDPHQ